MKKLYGKYLIILILFVFLAMVVLNLSSYFQSVKTTDTNQKNYTSLQRSFHEINSSYANKYVRCINEIQQDKVHEARLNALSKFSKNNSVVFENWIGQIKELWTTGNGGDAYLTILSTAENFRIKYRTKSGWFDDLFEGTSISKDSPVYNQMSILSIGDFVTFSGKFIKSDNNGRLESEGSIQKPEFIVQFDSIQKY